MRRISIVIRRFRIYLCMLCWCFEKKNYLTFSFCFCFCFYQTPSSQDGCSLHIMSCSMSVVSTESTAILSAFQNIYGAIILLKVMIHPPLEGSLSFLKLYLSASVGWKAVIRANSFGFSTFFNAPFILIISPSRLL